MCAIVLTESLGFIRIYPIDAEMAFRVWSKARLSLQRTTKDNRHESWRLCGDPVITGKIESAEQKRAILNRCTLNSGADDPIDYQNSRRKSVALCRVQHSDYSASLETKSPATDDHWVQTQQKAWNKPYIEWTSQQGKRHRTHILGREVYEGLRRCPESPWSIFDKMALNNPDYEHWLLLGNMRDRRNVWVCVHVHRLKKTSNVSTGLFFTPIDGGADEWPYSEQEVGNVPVADGQLLMSIT